MTSEKNNMVQQGSVWAYRRGNDWNEVEKREVWGVFFFEAAQIYQEVHVSESGSASTDLEKKNLQS